MAPSAGEPAPLVSWRSGVHIEGTSIWCDARRACDVCFASSVDALSRARHGQLIATQDTALLLEGREGRSAPILASPFSRPFTLGSVRLELFPSGYGLGAASLLVSTGGARVVYAGPVNLGPSLLGPAAEVRACDALVISGRALEVETLPDRDATLADLVAFCSGAIESGRSAVVLVSSVLEGMEIAAGLAAADPALGTISAHRSIHHAAQKLRQRHPELPPLRRFSGPARPQAILWPVKSRGRLDGLPWATAPAIALASALAGDARWIEDARASEGFAMANVADRRSLLGYVEATGAREIYVTEATREAVLSFGDKAGLAMHRLGGAEQMSLFV